MILQRLALSLKKRDWGLVLLEVLIVVIGIFVGLQVDGWNEGRKTKIRSEQLVAQLIDDTHLAIGNSKAEIERIQARVQGGLLVLRKLDGEELTPEEEEDFRAGLNNIIQSTPPELNIGLMGAILSGETIVVGPKLEDALREFENVARRRLDVMEHIGVWIDIENRILSRYFAIRSSNIPETEVRYDLDRMRNAPEFIYAFQSSIALQGERRSSVETLIEALQKLLLALEKSQ